MRRTGGSGTGGGRGAVAYGVATLFTIQTPALRLTWSGPAFEPEAGGLEVHAVGAEWVRLDGGEAVERTDADVRFEEETSYPVLLQSLDGEPVALHHRDPVLTAALVEGDGGRVVHGRVRFGSQAGRSRITLLAGGRPEVELDLIVHPTKLSTDDVRTMRREVEAASAGLALSALRPTSLGDAVGAAQPSVPVWIAALRQSVKALATALHEIDRRPVLDVLRALDEVRASAVRRPSAETRRRVQRTGLVERLPARPAALTADTPTHRWLAARLDRVLARLGGLASEEARRRPTARREVIRAEIDALAREVRRVRSLRTLAEAEDGRSPSVPPLVLRRRPVYSAAFDALRRLDRGLDLRDGALDVATQDLAVLYETWAALTVVTTAADVLGVEAPVRPFGVEARGTDVRLRRGRRWAVRLAGATRNVKIVTQPRFPAPPALLVQRPDLVLTVSEAGRVVRRVVLDAKYRRDDSAGYRRRHGAAGPPEDALGTLHRYRDAIVGPDRQPHIDRAVALFPGDDDAGFRASRLWTSIDALGVGAVPLRPGHVGALRDLLAGLIGA